MRSEKTMKMASALRFNPTEDAAPQVIAKGLGVVAENIIQQAEVSGVPIYEDAKLSEQLHALEVGEHIPYELYEVVAEILVFIGTVDKASEA